MKHIAPLLIALAFCASAIAANINVTYNINTDANKTPISKYIYGTNSTGNSDYTIVRSGGNRLTAYNWENNWSNAGADWLYENDQLMGPNTPPGKAITDFRQSCINNKQDSIVTLQMAGYVSAAKFRQIILPAEAAPSIYFYPVTFAKGTPFCDPPGSPDINDANVYMDEFVNFLVSSYGHAGDPNGVKFYCLDNEPDIWSDGNNHATHPEVHRTQAGCAEYKDKSVNLSIAVKNVDPNAQMLGPVSYGFAGYQTFQGAPDWKAPLSTGYSWFLTYYLDKMRDASDTAGKRLLDALDLHWYPEAYDGAPFTYDDNIGASRILNDVRTNAMYNARMQAPRTLWDTSYVGTNGENSWVNEWGSSHLPLIPKLKDDIKNYYHDTNLAFTEYAYGPDGDSQHWSTGIATADVLGIFGKYGVYIATYWGGGNYVDVAIKIYRNYDGVNSKFGDMNVYASMSNKVDSSIYASVSDDLPGELHLIVINKNQTDDITGTFNITSTQHFRSGHVWKFDNTSSTISETTGIYTITNNSFTYTIPKTSVCHIVLQITQLNVSITSPLDGDKFKPGDGIVIEANASDVNGFVTKVEFFQGSTKLGEDTEPPYSYTWNDVNVGRYSLIARATDNNNGCATASMAVNINVFSGDATGFILREWWTGITTGSNVSNLTSDINYPTNPNGRALLTSLEAPTDWADNYGTRIRGYLYPPADGNYTFWIASDDSSQLWLSTDNDPCHAVQIANVSGWTNSHEWTKYTSQISTPKSLLAGHKYYIEVLHKEGGGGDNLAVAWQGPGITQQVIDGFYLSPYLYNFKDYATFAPQWLITNCSRSNAWCSGADRDRDGNVQIDDLMVFANWWLYGGE